MYMLDAHALKGPIEEAATILENLEGFGAVGWYETERRQYRLEAYSEDEDVMRQGLAALAIMLPNLDVKYALLPPSDWIKMSLEGLPPVDAGRYRVLGSHDKSPIKKGKIEIIIDAGEAFGTGHHGTTRGCLLALERLVRQRKTIKSVLDVGTGSGVLAIAAAKIGAKCIGTEIDARAAEVARENLEINHVKPMVQIYVANGIRKSSIRKDAGYDLVFANILMKPLIKLSRDLSNSVKHGGHLVLSGLLTTQEPAIKRAFAQMGMVLVHTYHQDVWSTLTYKRP
jgi:ribosomal protein L11 methyltransferase